MRLTASVSGAHYFVSEESKVNLKIYKQVCIHMKEEVMKK